MTVIEPTYFTPLNAVSVQILTQTIQVNGSFCTKFAPSRANGRLPACKYRCILLIFNDFYGAPTRTRTADLLITNQLLYQLSYRGTPFQGTALTGCEVGLVYKRLPKLLSSDVNYRISFTVGDASKRRKRRVQTPKYDLANFFSGKRCVVVFLRVLSQIGRGSLAVWPRVRAEGVQGW